MKVFRFWWNDKGMNQHKGCVMMKPEDGSKRSENSIRQPMNEYEAKQCCRDWDDFCNVKVGTHFYLEEEISDLELIKLKDNFTNNFLDLLAEFKA